MKVAEYLKEKMAEKRLHMTLLDPDEQSAEEAAKVASIAEG